MGAGGIHCSNSKLSALSVLSNQHISTSKLSQIGELYHSFNKCHSYSIFKPFWGSFSREMQQILLHIVNVTTFHHLRNVMILEVS